MGTFWAENLGGAIKIVLGSRRIMRFLSFLNLNGIIHAWVEVCHNQWVGHDSTQVR